MAFSPNNPNGAAVTANSQPVNIASDQTVPVSAASLPLPAGAATSAAQGTGNTSVASIDTKTPALGQALSAASVPVVLTAAQITTLTPVSTVTANAGTNLNTSALALDATLTGGTQRTKITDGTNNAAVKAASTAAAATDPAVVVAISPNNTVPVSIATMPSTPVTGTFWQATQPVSLATNTPVIAAGSNTIGSVKATDGTNTAAVKAASTAAIATDPALVVAISPNNTVPVSIASLPSGAVTNAGTFAVQSTPVTQADTFMLGGVNVKEINAVAPLMGNGVTGTGSLRVTLASDTSSNTNAFLTTSNPTTTGGLSISHIVSAASTNATNIKASAGQVYGWYIYNSNAAARKVAFHNTAGTPTAGAAVVFSLVIPPSGAANVEFSNGIAFATGIAITMVTGLADSDATAVAANDLVCNIYYK